MIVVDSNVMAARNLTTVLTREAEQVEEMDPVWVVPPLWRYEFQNILAKAMWTRQLTLQDAMRAWTRVADQIAGNECEPSPERVIELTSHYRVTGYDANFIALAMHLGVPCVTEDQELHRKFPAVAVSMKNFLDQHQGPGILREAGASYRTSRRRSKAK